MILEHASDSLVEPFVANDAVQLLSLSRVQILRFKLKLSLVELEDLTRVDHLHDFLRQLIINRCLLGLTFQATLLDAFLIKLDSLLLHTLLDLVDHILLNFGYGTLGSGFLLGVLSKTLGDNEVLGEGKPDKATLILVKVGIHLDHVQVVEVLDVEGHLQAHLLTVLHGLVSPHSPLYLNLLVLVRELLLLTSDSAEILL